MTDRGGFGGCCCCCSASAARRTLFEMSKELKQSIPKSISLLFVLLSCDRTLQSIAALAHFGAPCASFLSLPMSLGDIMSSHVWPLCPGLLLSGLMLSTSRGTPCRANHVVCCTVASHLTKAFWVHFLSRRWRDLTQFGMVPEYPYSLLKELHSAS